MTEKKVPEKAQDPQERKDSIAVLTPITAPQRGYLEDETLVSWQDWPDD